MGKHDVNFKNLILDYLRAALLFFAGVEARRLPQDVKMTTVSESRLREWLGETGAIQDVVVKVEFPNGEREMLVFCIEHNSRERKNILKRQAKYCIQASIDLKTERVVPIAIFPTETRDVKERFKLGTEHGIYLDFRCITVKLNELEARKYVKSKNIVARLCLPFMKFEKAEKFETIRSSYESLTTLEYDTDKQSKYLGFLLQYDGIREDEREAFREQMVKGSSFEEEYMSTWDYAVKQGEKKGLLKGEAKGEAKGMARAIVALFKDGLLSAENAEMQLARFAAGGGISREFAEKALKQIRSS